MQSGLHPRRWRSRREKQPKKTPGKNISLSSTTSLFWTFDERRMALQEPRESGSSALWSFWSCCRFWNCYSFWSLCSGRSCWRLCRGCGSGRGNRFCVNANLHAPVLFTPLGSAIVAYRCSRTIRYRAYPRWIDVFFKGQILHDPLGAHKPQLVIVFRGSGVVGKTGNHKHDIAILRKVSLDVA